MARKRTTVAQLAREASLDIDETLVALWDGGFDDVTGPESPIQKGEANRARRVLGLSTRRELASPAHWERNFGLSAGQLDSLLQSIGVSRPYEGRKLRAKAIHRLQGELRARSDAQPAEQRPARSTTEAEAFVWEEVGHRRELTILSVEDVLHIHESLVTDFRTGPEPIEPPGVKSLSLLASACHRPTTSLGEVLKYPTIEMAAAAILHALVHDHPFHNGNKRTALVAMLVFLDENGFVLTCEEDELFKLVLQLAQHALVTGPRHELADREVLAVARWLKARSRWIEKGDRAISWRRLKQILSEYNCEFTFPASGSRVNISRTIHHVGFLGRRRKEILRTQTSYRDDGREVGKGTINKLRHDLHLDDEHGCDSAVFYDRASVSPSEFILGYRKTLRRLARL